MDNFIVSARKYRPQHFNTVVGQGHITSTLKNAISKGQLAQAYLFCGPRGVGKTTCARIFAKTINCTNITADGDACDRCESCTSFNSGASLNIYELDAASNNSVDDIRNLVDQVRFAPQLGEYKVYIIDEVHMLSNSAFNAFLKTLEEPPRHAKFILATTEKHKILPTILSRCQVFNFNRIKAEDISNHLSWLAQKENVQYEPEALHVIAQKADGGLRDACSIFDQMVAFTGNNLTYSQVIENLHVLDHDYYFKIVDALLESKLPQILLTFDDILRKGFDAHNFVLGLGEHLRNLLVSRDAQTTELLELSASLKQKYAEQARKCELQFLLRSLSLICRTDVNYKAARNQRLLVETTLLELSHLAAPQAEKKNNDVDSPPVMAARQAIFQQAKPVKTESTEQVKLASKPSVPFEKLVLKSQFSLREANAHQQTSAVAEEVVEKISAPAERYLNEPVTLEQISNCIQAYAEQKFNSGARQIGTIFKTAAIQLTGNTICLTIQNEAQKEQLLDIRQEFVDQLRNELRNNQISLEVKISESEPLTRAYKPLDIFKEMAERNPALLELKKRFDLEIDY